MDRNDVAYDPERAAQLTAAGLWNDDVLIDWLDHWAEQTPERIALLAPDESLTYAQLRAGVARVTGGLRALGIGAGDVVAAQLPNGVEFLLTFLGVTALGGVFQPVHMPYRRTDLEFLLGHGQAKAVVCLPRFKDFETAATLLELKDQLPYLDHIITTDDGPAGTTRFEDLAASTALDLADCRPDPADPYLLLYTSGTTSNPKGVPHTYRNLLAAIRLAAPELGMTADDRVLSVANFSHMWGIYNYQLTLQSGAAAILLPQFTPQNFAETVERHRVTAAFAAPAHMSATLAAGLFDGRDLTSLRMIALSGAPCPLDAWRRMNAHMPGGDVVDFWGMTEMSGGAFVRPGTPMAKNFGTVGTVVPGSELRVASADGSPMPAGVEGELEIRGCTVFAGYLRNPAANAGAFRDDHWFRTGDLATIDAEGNVRITGRVKDVINRGGVKYNPTEIEALLADHPAISEVAIVPMPDPVLGERACCFAVAAPGANERAAPTLEDLCAYLDDREVAKTKWPERLVLVDAMPLTPTRKVIKGELEKRLAAERAPGD